MQFQFFHFFFKSKLSFKYFIFRRFAVELYELRQNYIKEQVTFVALPYAIPFSSNSITMNFILLSMKIMPIIQHEYDHDLACVLQVIIFNFFILLD
jgi:hypothetical protein